MSELLSGLLGAGITAFLILAILKNPEKVEKWVALACKLVHALMPAFTAANKLYRRLDTQATVNDFIKRNSKGIPGFATELVKINWVEGIVQRKAFIQNNEVVICIRRNDPREHNVVNSIYYFITVSLLYRAKRYISTAQAEATNLFVAKTMFQQEKPHLVDIFLETYLHPKLEDKDTKLAEYFNRFAIISEGGLFFPILLPEVDFIGQKVFGGPKNDRIIQEVHQLVLFLERIATRSIGDDSTPLNFTGEHCRFAVMVVGKKEKLSGPINQWTNYIRQKLIPAKIETIYLLSKPLNKHMIQDICNFIADSYECVGKTEVMSKLHYEDKRIKMVPTFVAVVRAIKRDFYEASHT